MLYAYVLQTRLKWTKGIFFTKQNQRTPHDCIDNKKYIKNNQDLGPEFQKGFAISEWKRSFSFFRHYLI